MRKILLRPAATVIYVILLIVGLLLTFSCQKENSFKNNIPAGQQRVSIRLSDDPVNFDAVNVDIQAVEVLVVPDSCDNGHDEDEGCFYDHAGDHYHHDFSCAVWDTLDIRPGVYDLLNLSNGVDTLLASGFTVQGKIKRIRLTLGTNNSVVIDSVQYPLELWSNYNRVTIVVRGESVDQISPDDLQIWLDFDAGRSIVKLYNNHFVLKSYLRIWLPAQTASIKGKVAPLSAHAVVSAIANNDTLVAIPEHYDGRFKIRGLRGSTADLFINATANGYHDTTITGISLHAGQETDVGAIQLHN